MNTFSVFCQGRGGEALKRGEAKGVPKGASKSPSYSRLPFHRPPLQAPGALIPEPSEDSVHPAVSVGFPTARLVLGFLRDAELTAVAPSAFLLTEVYCYPLLFSSCPFGCRDETFSAVLVETWKKMETYVCTIWRL